MNQYVLEVRARTKEAELREEAARIRQSRRCGPGQPRQSLRQRTGWTLVDVGLRLVAEQRQVTPARS
jgi:hypothetical protein